MSGSGPEDPPDTTTPLGAEDAVVARDGKDAAEQLDENVVRVDFRRGARVEDTAGPAADEKLKIFRELIASGMVMVTLDARRPGVNVPSRFAKDAQLNLNFSHRFGVADFTYDEQGVRATLTFGGHPFYCDVPWGAVWGLRSHVDSPDQVTVFHDALPDELLEMLPQSAREQLQRAQQRRAQDRAERDADKPAGADASSAGKPLAGKAPDAPRARGGLRLVRPEPVASTDDDDEPETIPDRTDE